MQQFNSSTVFWIHFLLVKFPQENCNNAGSIKEVKLLKEIVSQITASVRSKLYYEKILKILGISFFVSVLYQCRNNGANRGAECGGCGVLPTARKPSNQGV